MMGRGIDVKNLLKCRFDDLALNSLKEVHKSFTDSVNCLDLDIVDNRYLLSGAADGTIYIHDTWNFSGTPSSVVKDVGKVTKRNKNCHKQSCECVQWSPLDTGMFTSSGMDKCLKVWDTNVLKAVEVIKCEGRIYQHHTSTISTKRSLVAVASSIKNVVLVDLVSGCHTHELRGHTDTTVCVRFSTRDENLLATAGKDHNIIFWDVRRAKSYLKTLRYKKPDGDDYDENATSHTGTICSLCFTSDGLFLLSLGNDKRLRLWDALTGDFQNVDYGKIPVDTKRFYRTDTTSELSDEKVFVPSEGKVIVLDIHSGKKEKVLIGHHNYVHSCVYSSVNQELYSGGVDQNVLVWSGDSKRNTVYEEFLKEKDRRSVNYTPINVLPYPSLFRSGTVFNYDNPS